MDDGGGESLGRANDAHVARVKTGQGQYVVEVGGRESELPITLWSYCLVMRPPLYRAVLPTTAARPAREYCGNTQVHHSIIDFLRTYGSTDGATNQFLVNNISAEFCGALLWFL